MKKKSYIHEEMTDLVNYKQVHRGALLLNGNLLEYICFVYILVIDS